MKHDLIYDGNGSWGWLAQSVLLRAVKDYVEAKEILQRAENGGIVSKVRILDANVTKQECIDFFLSDYGRLFFNEIEAEEFIRRIDNLSLKRGLTIKKEEIW